MYNTQSPISVAQYSNSRGTMSMSMLGSVHGPSAKPKPTIPNKKVNHMPGVRQFDLPFLTPVRTVFSTWEFPH